MNSLTTTTRAPLDIKKIESVLIKGDLSSLDEGQRINYYNAVCESVGLNPLTKPFDYLKLGGRDVLYANKGCAEQLRSIHDISIESVDAKKIDDLVVVIAKARSKDGRTDSSTGAVSVGNLKGEALANAMMKAETKAKRRVTLSLCGLNMLDESEVESIPGAEKTSEPRVVQEVRPEIQNAPPKNESPASQAQVKKMFDAVKAAKIQEAELRGVVKQLYAKEAFKDLRVWECLELSEMVRSMPRDDFFMWVTETSAQKIQEVMP